MRAAAYTAYGHINTCSKYSTSTMYIRCTNAHTVHKNLLYQSKKWMRENPLEFKIQYINSLIWNLNAAIEWCVQRTILCYVFKLVYSDFCVASKIDWLRNVGRTLKYVSHRIGEKFNRQQQNNLLSNCLMLGHFNI